MVVVVVVAGAVSVVVAVMVIATVVLSLAHPGSGLQHGACASDSVLGGEFLVPAQQVRVAVQLPVSEPRLLNGREPPQNSFKRAAKAKKDKRSVKK